MLGSAGAMCQTGWRCIIAPPPFHAMLGGSPALSHLTPVCSTAVRGSKDTSLAQNHHYFILAVSMCDKRTPITTELVGAAILRDPTVITSIACGVLLSITRPPRRQFNRSLMLG